jgi:hypothetical protein
MSYGPNIPPMGTGVPHGPILDTFFPRTLAYATPNPRVGDSEGDRDQIARTLREVGSCLEAELDRTKSVIPRSEK